MKDPISPETFSSWSSMEGVTDEFEAVALPKASPDSRSLSEGPRAAVHRWLEYAGKWMPGIGLAAGVAWLAELSAHWAGTRIFGFDKSPVGGVPVAILLGLVVCNTAGVPAIFKPGLKLCSTLLLRTAIVLLGLRLSLGMVAGIGWQALPVVILCIATALIVVPWLGARAGLPRRLALLISVGTGICGVTAIVATAPAIKAEEDEVGYAVACIAIFGLVAMLIHPWIAHAIFGANVEAAGMFLGTAIHDTSQVAGAALSYELRFSAPEALDFATVTKLLRNMFLAVAIPLVAWMYSREGSSLGGRKASWKSVFPLFVVGFVGMTILRTIGDSTSPALGFLGASQWEAILGHANGFSAVAITVVMGAIGLQTDFSKFKRLGLRPLVVGLSAAVAVGVVSVIVLQLMGVASG